MSKKWLGKVIEENGWSVVEFDDSRGAMSWIDLVDDEKTLAIGADRGYTSLTKSQARCLINHLECWIKTGKLR